MILRWSVYLSLDQLNALIVRLEDERWWSQDEDFLAACRELVEAREHAIEREFQRGRIGFWDELPETLGLKPPEAGDGS